MKADDLARIELRVVAALAVAREKKTHTHRVLEDLHSDAEVLQREPGLTAEESALLKGILKRTSEKPSKPYLDAEWLVRLQALVGRLRALSLVTDKSAAGSLAGNVLPPATGRTPKLKDRLENDILWVCIGVGIAAFTAGLGAYRAALEITNQTTVVKGTCQVKQDASPEQRVFELVKTRIDPCHTAALRLRTMLGKDPNAQGVAILARGTLDSCGDLIDTLHAESHQ